MKANRYLQVILLFFLALIVSPQSHSQSCESDNWDNNFFRPNQLSASKVVASNGKIFVAGTFTETYDLGGGNRSSRQVAGIVTFDGVKWNFPSFDQGLDAGGSWSFTDMIVFGNEVIVSGSFTQTNAGDTTIKYIARWDGTNWSALGSGVNNVVTTLATSGGFDIYAGGQFTRIGTDTAHYVAKWTSGSGWEPLYDPSNTQQGTSHPVQSLTLYNNRLILGGAFTSVGGGTPANHLAEWNWTTQAWNEFGGGVNTNVQHLATGVSGVYVADISDANGTPITGVALWDGASWTDLATPTFSGIQDIACINGGDLVAVGSYLDTPPGTFNRHIAKYNPLSSQWEDLLDTCNLDASPTDLFIDGTDIYAVFGSSFGATYACNSALGSFAKFDGTKWRGYGEGMTSNGAWGTALQISDTAVYVGGILGHLGAYGIHNGAGQWSLQNKIWNSFTENDTTGFKIGVYDGTIWDIHEIDGNVYSVGQFTSAGPLATNSIVGWNGSSFFTLGGGTDVSSIVYAVEPFQGNIYFGGYIFNITQPNMSSESLGGFLRWTGAQYEQPAGSSLNFVMELENTGDYLYIGGQFNSSVNTPTANIVRYDGAVFDSVGGGTNGRVLDIKVSGSDVYAAGGFLSVKNKDGSQVDAGRLARWDGTTWESVGVFNDTVRAIYIRGSEIYAAGHFTEVDGISASHIAYYDGSTWKALGEGTEGEITINNGEVYELDSDGENLWLVGRFSHANHLPSQNIARWKFCTEAPLTFNDGGSGSTVDGTNVTLTWDALGTKSAANTYNVQVATDGDFSNITHDADGIATNSYQVTSLLENTDYFWRVKLVTDSSDGAWSARQSFQTGIATTINEYDNLLPNEFVLSQNYPNPFNPSTNIRFSLPEKSDVQLVVYNLLGKKVRTLVNQKLSAGNYEVVWEGKNDLGDEVASGVYFYKISTNNFTQNKKMVLLK